MGSKIPDPVPVDDINSELGNVRRLRERVAEGTVGGVVRENRARRSQILGKKRESVMVVQISGIGRQG